MAYLLSVLSGVFLSILGYLVPEQSSDYLLPIHFLYGLFGGWLFRIFTPRVKLLRIFAASFWFVYVFLLFTTLIAPSYDRGPMTLSALVPISYYLAGTFGIYLGWKLRSRSGKV